MPYLKSTIAILWLVLVAVRSTVAAGSGVEPFGPAAMVGARLTPNLRVAPSPSTVVSYGTPAHANVSSAIDELVRAAMRVRDQRPSAWALLVTGVLGAGAIMRRRTTPLHDLRIGRTPPRP